MTPSFDFAYLPTGPSSETALFAQLGEALSYRCMWIPDQGFMRDPFVLLCGAANTTRRVGLGIGITTPLTRHPVQIARVAATLDELSDGRLRLGLGNGNIPNLLKPLALAGSGQHERVRAGVAAVRALLRGEAVAFAPPADKQRSIQLELPVRPNIPVYIGARGPKMLALAGELGDGVLIESLFNHQGLHHARSCLREGAHRVGRAHDEIDVVSWQVVVVTDDVPQAIERQRQWIANSIQAGPRDALLRIGIDEATISSVVTTLSRGGGLAEAAKFVTDDTVRCLMIVGRPNEVVKRIETVLQDGATSICVLNVGSVAEVAANITRFGREVIPAFGRQSAG